MSTNPNEPDATVAVVVDGETTGETPAVETGDTTVIVETPPTDQTPGHDPIELEHRLTRLEQRIDEAVNTAFEAKWEAANAATVADDAGEFAEAATEDAVETVVEAVDGAEVVEDESTGDDVVQVDASPGRQSHWLTRSWDEWRFKK